MRHYARRDVTGANLVLSFIDVLASAMGAAVLLFVVLASSPISVPGKAQAAGGFIRYEWSVSNPDALMRIVLRKDGQQLDYVDLPSLNGPSVRYQGEIAGVASYALIGFEDNPDNSSNQPVGGTYILRLNRPDAGKWEVGVAYFQWNSALPVPPKTVVNLEVATDSKARCESAEVRHVDPHGAVTMNPLADPVELSFGDHLFAPVVTAVDKPNEGAAEGVEC